MSRKMANEATDAELKELAVLLSDDPGLHYTLNMVEELTPLPKPGDAATDDELARKRRGMNKLDELLAPAVRRRLPVRWMAAAGVMLLAGAGGVLYWVTGISSRPSVAETAFGVTKKEVLLPDGSAWCSTLAAN